MSSWVTLTFLLGVGMAAAACTAHGDSRALFLESLIAPGPNDELKRDLMTFGRFIGDWEMDIQFFDENGNSIFHGPGRWSFSWVLDGRAIQDVITYEAIPKLPSAGNRARRTGTTLRHFSPELNTWRVVFLGATSGVLVVLTGGQRGAAIVLQGSEAPGVLNRWSFSEVTHNRFRWLGEISHDNGTSWRVEQEMWGRRTGAEVPERPFQGSAPKL